jgi:hypothetical protein
MCVAELQPSALEVSTHGKFMIEFKYPCVRVEEESHRFTFQIFKSPYSPSLFLIFQE